ncbi:MAG: hypothetical protein ACRDGF_00980 [Chloroflexota bacterium]
MRRLWSWFRPLALLALVGGLLRARQARDASVARTSQRFEREVAAEREIVEEAEDTLPEPTIWPLVLAVGIFMGLWGIILGTFFFGLGLLLCLLALTSWMNILLHDEHDYLKLTPHEPWRGRH